MYNFIFIGKKISWKKLETEKFNTPSWNRWKHIFNKKKGLHDKIKN